MNRSAYKIPTSSTPLRLSKSSDKSEGTKATRQLGSGTDPAFRSSDSSASSTSALLAGVGPHRGSPQMSNDSNSSSSSSHGLISSPRQNQFASDSTQHERYLADHPSDDADGGDFVNEYSHIPQSLKEKFQDQMGQLLSANERLNSQVESMKNNRGVKIDDEQFKLWEDKIEQYQKSIESK